jgi:hypothetical protein
MKRTILLVSLTVTCSLSIYSQQLQTGTAGQSSSKSSATTSLATRQIDIQSGTRLAAELQNTVDVRKAKIGDEVILKTTQAIKSEGRTVVNKGARLLGRVTEVGQRTKASGESRIGIGSAVDATGRTVGGATAGTGRSLGRIQITESSSTSAEGGVVLSLRGENLRLEKGLTFNLLLNQSANVGTPN